MIAKKLSITWLSANKFGFELIKTALQIPDIKINGIITLSEKSSTRMYDGIPIHKWKTLPIPVFPVSSINDEARLIHRLSPDYIVMCGWRQIIDKKILSIPKKGVIAFHPTMLPKGRGPAPIINTVLSGWKTGGVTMYVVDDLVDHGPIIGQLPFSIGSNDTAKQMYSKIMHYGKKLVRTYLPRVAKGNIQPVRQNDRLATYFPKRTMKNNEILPKDSLETAYRKIRAFTKPYRGAYIKKGNKKLILWDASLIYEK